MTKLDELLKEFVEQWGWLEETTTSGEPLKEWFKRNMKQAYKAGQADERNKLRAEQRLKLESLKGDK